MPDPATVSKSLGGGLLVPLGVRAAIYHSGAVANAAAATVANDLLQRALMRPKLHDTIFSSDRNLHSINQAALVAMQERRLIVIFIWRLFTFLSLSLSLSCVLQNELPLRNHIRLISNISLRAR